MGAMRKKLISWLLIGVMLFSMPLYVFAEESSESVPPQSIEQLEPLEQATSPEQPKPPEQAASPEQPKPPEQATSPEQLEPLEQATSPEQPEPLEQAASPEQPKPPEQAASPEQPKPPEQAASPEQAEPPEEAASYPAEALSALSAVEATEREIAIWGDNPIATADAKPIDYQDGIHYIQDDTDGKIALFCMNNLLNMPHWTSSYGDTPVPNYQEGYLSEKDFTSKAQYEEFIRRVTNLLYAGYPHNAAGLYEIVENENMSEPTLEAFHEMLIPPAQLANDFPKLKHYSFAYPAEEEELEVLSDFVREVGKLSGNTPGGLSKDAILSMPFYKAAICMTMDAKVTPMEIFGYSYGASYFVTEEQAYGATQNALWKLLYDYGIEDNGISSLSGIELAETLTKFSKQGIILTKAPELQKLKLEGELKFSYHPKDGFWHSTPLKLVEPEGYNGIYHLSLPKGVRTLHNLSYVYGNEEYELVSDHPIQNGETFGFEAEFTWLKGFKQYTPIPDITVNGKRFQRMGGSVLQKTTLRNTLVQKEQPEGNLSVTKTVVGGGDGRAFNFSLYLPDTPIHGTYGDVDFQHGLAYFQLKHGETKQIRHLPAGVAYLLKEIADGSFTAKSQNASGIIQKDQTIAASFLNTPLPDLTICKKVSGNGGDLLHPFSFTIDLRDAAGNPLDDSYECYGEIAAGCEQDKVSAPKDQYLDVRNGKAQLSLSHGQQFTIKGLPYQSTYTITETDTEGYTVSYNGNSSPATGTLEKDESIEVRNEKQTEPPVKPPVTTPKPPTTPPEPPTTPPEKPEKPTAPQSSKPNKPIPNKPEAPIPQEPSAYEVTVFHGQKPIPQETEHPVTQPMLQQTIQQKNPLPGEPQAPAASESVTLAPAKPTEEINTKVQQLDSGVPETGDATGISFWLMLLGSSCAGMAMVLALAILFTLGIRKKH